MVSESFRLKAHGGKPGQGPFAAPGLSYPSGGAHMKSGGHAFSGVPGAASRLPPAAGVDGNWTCVACQNVNFAMRKSADLY